MVVLHFFSGALQVPDDNAGSTVMLAGPVGAGDMLRPAGNKFRSITGVGDATSELWKPS